MLSRREFYVQRLPTDRPPYQVDTGRYSRFDQRNNMSIGRPNWDESVQKFWKRMPDVRAKNIQKAKPGYRVEDYSLFVAAGAVASEFGTRINHANRGLTSWTCRQELTDLPRWVGSPEAASAMVKRAARFLGADLVGIAPLDPLWLYSHAVWEDGTHKEIVVDTVGAPIETELQLVIPEKMRWVVVMGSRMDPLMMGTVPAAVGCAETNAAYSRMAMLVSTMAQFLRGLGYRAIPSLNDLGLNIPMAMDAGLGEQGRSGALVTPEFGPSIRLCKVVTDLPMARDHPIRFGVSEFCDRCFKCADRCPAHSISKTARTWTGPSISNNPGHYSWYGNPESCRKYQALGPADNCAICVRVCPFTTSIAWVHDLTRLFIARVPVLNPLWRRLDEWLGYGKERDASWFWRAEGYPWRTR